MKASQWEAAFAVLGMVGLVGFTFTPIKPNNWPIALGFGLMIIPGVIWVTVEIVKESRKGGRWDD